MKNNSFFKVVFLCFFSFLLFQRCSELPGSSRSKILGEWKLDSFSVQLHAAQFNLGGGFSTGHDSTKFTFNENGWMVESAETGESKDSSRYHWINDRSIALEHTDKENDTFYISELSSRRLTVKTKDSVALWFVR